MVTVEIGAAAGLVCLLISDHGDQVEIVMSADECRDLCNGLGEAIQCASAARTGVMT
jgi:hypothetical protein